MDTTKKGLDAVGAGLSYDTSWKSTLKNDWKKENPKNFYLTCGFIPV